MQNLQTFGIL